jgi:hypothetical protein
MPPKSKPELEPITLVFAGPDDRMIHVGGGHYVHVTAGDPVPDGVDPSTLGPDWVPSNATSVAPTTTEEV